MKIGKIGERALINEIAALVAKTADKQVIGIGDDAALTPVSADCWLATSKDMLIEGIHFLLPEITAKDLGYKSLAVNLSDLAAMGAKPRHAYVALALPPETEHEFVLAFYQGMLELAERFNVTICGGDLVASPGPMVISVTVQGEVPKTCALLRRGASAGDIVCTTGPLGASAAGLLLLTHKIQCSQAVRTAALQAHYRPWPRVEEAMWLAQTGMVTSAIDLSDGLLKDILEVLEQNKCGVLLEAEKIPIHPAAVKVAASLAKPAWELALNGGEDYELLCTVKAAHFAELTRAYEARFAQPLYALGRLTAEREIRMITKEGKWEKIEFTGFKHF
ncbi:MAG: thiamine-phosphate kinase [Firmicutes bacterium]|nr:thiamine-phosphate kinase [Bacillota bacterium]